MKNIIKKLIKIIVIILMLITTVFSASPPVYALSQLSGDEILQRAQTYSDWDYYAVGTCTGLVTRVLDDLDIGDSIVGSMVGNTAKFTPDKMYANALSNPSDAKLIWEGPVSSFANYSTLVKNGDLVIQKAVDKVPYDGFGHVGFIHKNGSTISMFGANNPENGVSDATLTTNAKGVPVGKVDPKNIIRIFRLVEDTQYGNLKITKQNEDGVNVANTSFKLSHNSDMSSPLGTYTTGSDGTITIPNIEAKTVYIQETSVPDDLILDKTIQSVTIPANGTATYIATNSFKKGNLEISKQDEDGTYVPNTSFSLSYNADMSSPLGTYTTGANGKVLVENLRAKKVYVQETAVPDNLILDKTIQSVTIPENDTATYTATNTFKKGHLEISKQDEDGTYVPNTSFSLSYNADMSSPLGIYTTGANGKVLVENLRARKVYVQETSVPDPLILDKAIRSVTVLYNQTVAYNASNIYKTGNLVINKLDIDTGKPVRRAGAEFSIYKANGTFVKTISTNDKGVASLTGIRWGDYYFVETKAPSSYVLNSTQVPFEIRENGVTITKSLSNKRTLGSIQLEKVDKETGKTAQGDATLNDAIYELRAKENILSPDDHHVIYKAGELVKTMIIKDGAAKVENLYLGKYEIKEKAPSTGYLIDPTAYEVNITYTDQNKKVELRNATSSEQVMKRAFQIIKISSDGSSGTTPILKGAQFTIKLESEVKKVGWDNARTYDQITTDNSGYAKSIELPYGQFRVRETIVPANHSQVADFFVNIVNDSREPIKWTVQNDVPYKTFIGIVKLDSETGDIVRLEGAKFKIYNLDTNSYEGWWQWNPIPEFIDEFETNEDGNVMTPGSLRAGHYKLIETQAPNGMILNRESKPFTITADGAHQIGPDGSSYVTNITFANKPTKGRLVLEKTADLFMGYEEKETEFGTLYQPIFEEGLLSGVTYEIKARENIVSADGRRVYYHKGQVVETIKTDGKKATMSSLLPLGAYTVQEIACEDDGYVIDSNIYDFDLIYKDQVTEVVYQTMKPFNEKQRAVGTINKDIEESDMMDNSEVYEKIKFGVFTKDALTVNGKKVLEKDSMVQIVSLADTLKGNVQVDFASDYYLKELSTDEQYVLSVALIPFNFTYANDKETVIEINGGEPIYNVVKRGSVKIHKTDALTNNPLVNVRYEVATDEKFEHVVKETSTDERGYAIFEELEKGTYYLREKYDDIHDMVIEGYVKDPTIHEIVIEENEQVIELFLENIPVRGQVTFTKKGETFNNVDVVEGEYGTEYHPRWEETTLLGSELTIYAAEDIITWDGTKWYDKDEEVLTLESDWDTVNSVTLPVGKFYAKETKVPHGYVCDTMVYKFEIVKNGSEEIQINPITIINNRAVVTINLKKAMEEQATFVNSDAYKEVVYGLYAREGIYDYMGNVAIESDSLIGTSTIDEDGNLTSIYDLPIGTYYFKELKTNDQYVLDTKEYDFEVDYQGQDVVEFTIDINQGETIHNYLKRGSVEILKTDKESTKPLVNVHFELATDEAFANILKEGITGENGVAIFEELEKGAYYIREQYDDTHDMVIEGHVKDDAIHKVEVNEDKQVIKLDIVNQPVRGKVTFDKTGETFNDVKIVEGTYGNEYHPIWKETALLGSVLTIEAMEDITTWDGKEWFKKGDVATTIESDWDTAESIQLPVGKYAAYESQTPHGYITSDERYEFEITPNGKADIQINPVAIYNERATVTLNMKKAMEEQATFVNPEAYKEVVYGLYAREGIYDYMGNIAIESGSLIGTSTIDEDGNLTSIYDLPNGTYYFKELKTNDQYVLDTKEYDFEISYQGADIVEYTIDINQNDTIYNYLKRGFVEIMKTDKESTKPLVNVHFELSTDEAFTNILKETATGENGKAIFEELEKGTYYIREQYDNEHDMVIEGYVKDETIHKVEVKEDKEIIEIDMENQPIKGKVIFDKTGETFNDVKIVEGTYGNEYHPIWKETALLGSVLTIEAMEDITTWDGKEWFKKGDVATTIESDWDTAESIQLPVGKYAAYESQTPHGYITDPSRYEFEVTPNGKADIQINPISIFNERADVDINLTKTLEEQKIFVNAQAYEDVVFGLYARENIYDYMGNTAIENGSLLGISTINEEGHLSNTFDLPNGTYYFKELVTNGQYVISDDEYDFEIGYQGADVTEYTVDINDGKEIENKLIHGTIEVNKITHDSVHYDALEQAYLDSFGKLNSSILRNNLLKDDVNYLTGVEFQLATDKEFKNVIRSEKTDITGRLLFKELERGTYYVRESKHLEAYKVNSEVFEVMIEKDGQFETLNVDNTLVESFALIKKVDEADTSLVLSGAEFILYSDAECTKEIDKQTTQADGLVLFTNIKFGETVYAKETKAPTGYELDHSVHEIHIDYEWIKNSNNETRTIQITNKKTPPINTGDYVDTGMYLMAFVVSSGVLLGIAKRKRTKKSK